MADKDWEGDPLKHRQLVKSTFGNGCAAIVRAQIPCRDVTMCRLTVYFEKNEPLRREWNPTVQFVSYYLAMLIMAMRGLHPWTELLEEPRLQELLKDVPGDVYLPGRALHTLDMLQQVSEKRLEETIGHVSTKTQVLVDLRGAYEKKKLVVVLGAGINVPYGGPNWHELLHRLLIKSFGVPIKRVEWLYMLLSGIFSKFFAGKSPIITARFLRRRFKGDGTFEKQVHEAIYESLPKREDFKPEGGIYAELAKLCFAQEEEGRIHSVITYNYDELLEESLEMRKNELSKHITDYHEEGFVSIDDPDQPDPGDRLPIYHVHGHVPRDPRTAEKKTVILSEEMYHQQYIHHYRWNNIEQLSKLIENPCLFVGLSFEDPNLRLLMDVAATHRRGHGPRHCILRWKGDKTDTSALANALESIIGMALKEDSRSQKDRSPKDSTAKPVADMIERIMKTYDNSEEEIYAALGARCIPVRTVSDIGNILAYIRTGDISKIPPDLQERK